MEEIQRQPHLHAFRFDPIIENREQVGHSLARAIGRDREPEAFMRLGLLPRLLDKILCVSRISILIVRLANSLPLAASACKAPAKFSVHVVSSGPGRASSAALSTTTFGTATVSTQFLTHFSCPSAAGPCSFPGESAKCPKALCRPHATAAQVGLAEN